MSLPLTGAGLLAALTLLLVGIVLMIVECHL